MVRKKSIGTSHRLKTGHGEIIGAFARVSTSLHRIGGNLFFTKQILHNAVASQQSIGLGVHHIGVDVTHHDPQTLNELNGGSPRNIYMTSCTTRCPLCINHQTAQFGYNQSTAINLQHSSQTHRPNFKSQSQNEASRSRPVLRLRGILLPRRLRHTQQLNRLIQDGSQRLKGGTGHDLRLVEQQLVLRRQPQHIKDPAQSYQGHCHRRQLEQASPQHAPISHAAGFGFRCPISIRNSENRTQCGLDSPLFRDTEVGPQFGSTASLSPDSTYPVDPDLIDR